MNLTFDPNEQESIAKALKELLGVADIKGIKIAEYDHDANGRLILKLTHTDRSGVTRPLASDDE